MALLIGLQTGLETGLLTGLGTSVHSSGIPQTLDGIANAADPLQSLADAMGTSFKFDYLWIGNETTGATELGGSGLDLTGSTLDQEQADSRLGAGNTCLFNGNADRMYTADQTLNIGTGAVAIIHIHAYNTYAAGANMVVGKYSGASGGYHASTNGSYHTAFSITTSSGVFSPSVAVNHGTVNAQVDLLQRLVSSNLVSVITRGGTSTVAEPTITTADSTQEFAIGFQLAVSSGARFNWGLTAVIKGANAELVTATHRSNLQTWLGF